MQEGEDNTPERRYTSLDAAHEIASCIDDTGQINEELSSFESPDLDRLIQIILYHNPSLLEDRHFMEDIKRASENIPPLYFASEQRYAVRAWDELVSVMESSGRSITLLSPPNQRRILSCRICYG